MADNSPPPMIRHQLFKAAHAPPVHLTHVGGRGAGGSSSQTSTGNADGLTGAFSQPRGRTAADDITDPTVSGDFERTPAHTNLFGVMGGDLTPRGKEQQALNARIQTYGQQLQSLTSHGASFTDAMHLLVRANPQMFNDLSAHPQALRSMENLTQVLGGGNAGPQNVGLSKSGAQVLQRDEQGNLRYADIPGYTAPTGKAPTLLKTDQGYSTLGANGMATPVLGPNGERVMPAPAGKAQQPMVQSDIPGLPPQVASDTPKTAFNRQNYTTLTATPEVMAALQRMQTAAAAMGPIKGPIASLSGEYFGLNGTGAQFRADQDLIRSQAQKMAGSGYAAATKNFMEGIGTASNAPSFLKLQAEQMLTTLRNEGQNLADEETASHQGKLPSSLANQLIKSGIVPNGYQNQETFDQMPPGEAALWKSRFAPQSLGDADKAQLATDAANGKFGSPNAQNTNADFKNIVGIRAQDKAKEVAKQQQQTASTAALATQPPQPSSNPAQVSPGGIVQPTPGTEPGAQQPPQPTQQGQGQQQQPQQPAAPSNLQGNGQQGQANNPQNPAQSTPPGAGLAPGAVTAPLPPLMPPQAVPGQPAQGMPATNATTPQPPPSPLPAKTSQMLTPQGSVPTPAAQAPLAATTPTDAIQEQLRALAPTE